MFNKILVPTDGSTLSDVAITAALQFAKDNGSEIVALSVSEPYMYATLSDGFMADPVLMNSFNSKNERDAQDYVDKVSLRAEQLHVPCTVMTTQSERPAEEIIEASKKHHCDVIFMATHGRKGLTKLLHGSETQQVLAASDVPVLVFR
jgi:nucleotide-binding universal stress UspA family protein